MSDDGLLAGRYRRVRALGRGAMGEVWLAEDLELDRRVAIKTVRFDVTTGGDSLALERMVREARVAARLRHRHIVTVYDLIRDGDQPHVIMEYVDGESLAELVRSSGPLNPVTAAHLLGQVADALDQAHRIGVVHRDIKPANILIDSAGEARLADFGIARGLGDAVLTDTGQAIGTVAFMAPEVARDGNATAASDVWSLGATLYAALEGRAPYQATASSTAVQILTRLATEPVPPPTNAGALTPVLMSMLDPDPKARPTSAGVASRLSAVGSSGELATARLPSVVSKPPRQAALVPPDASALEAPTAVAPSAVSAVDRTPTAAEGLPKGQPAHNGPLQRHRRTGLIAGAAAVVIAATVAVIVGVSPDAQSEGHTGSRASGTREGAASAAEAAMVTLQTYDYRSLGTWKSKIEPLMTARLRARYEKTWRTVATLTRRTHASDTAAVTQVSVTAASVSAATVRVAGVTTVRNALLGHASRQERWSVDVSLAWQGGRWLVDDISPYDGCAPISPNPPAKGEPRIPLLSGPIPTALVSKDIKRGRGRMAQVGDHLAVKYVGVGCDNGEVFDASYTNGSKGQLFRFTLGSGTVIKGWDEGMVGMRQGGVRELVIPPSLAYGSTGTGPIHPNETLIFVVTLVRDAS